MRRLVALAVVLSLAGEASAHNEWANGAKIPDWVKSSCCGPADAHHLTPDQVHDMGDYYRIDGMQNDIPKAFGPKHFPNSAILPSQDGDYWVFYRDAPEHDTYNQYSNSKYHAPASESIYCFFVPMEF